MDSAPVFDFSTPWIALIQVALIFVLPTLVGLVTDRFSSSILKVVLLGGLTLSTTVLTGLLDAMLAGTPYDWLNVVLNGLITWALSVAAYLGILKPSGVIAKAQSSTLIQMFPASSARVAQERKSA